MWWMPELSDLGVSTCRCVIPLACDYTMHVSFSIFIATRPSDRGSQLLWSGLAFGLQYSLYVASERHWSHIHVITLCVDVGHARRGRRCGRTSTDWLRGFPTTAALLSAISERCKRHKALDPGTLGMTSPKGFLSRHASKKSSRTNVYRKFKMST